PTLGKNTAQGSKGNSLSATVFGDSRNLLARINLESPFFLQGTVGVWNEFTQLASPAFIHAKDIGSVMPVYSGKEGVISPETVRERVGEHLETSIPAMASLLRQRMGLDSLTETRLLSQSASASGKWRSLESLLREAHAPASPESGFDAQCAIKRLATYDLLRQASASAMRPPSPNCAIPIPEELILKVTTGLPFSFTDEQERAVREICADLSEGTRPMLRLLSGDVGTGKTLVLGAVCAAVTAAGKTVAWLSPNGPLALQTRDVLAKHWPLMNPGLVAGDSDGIPDTLMLVGTTALNFRLSVRHIDLHITDEEQKLGVNAKSRLVGEDTHVILATATCIPGTNALIQYGGIAVSRLAKTHAKRDIKTRIVVAEHRKKLFDSILATIKAGYQALIVYPLAETKDDAEKDIKSAEVAFKIWDRHLPGRVRLIHGKMKDAEKSGAIHAMREGRADALISTSLTEAGIDLDRLRHVVIVHAERMGLASLHQLRGRVARQGGAGVCDLFLPEPVKDESLNRLRILLDEADGFKVATRGMWIKGFGDLTGMRQSGESHTFLPGHVPSFDDVEWVAEFWMGQS
ncbi:MAG: helicase-related protein, partial [Candidatus Methylumidiphilus sp.]